MRKQKHKIYRGLLLISIIATVVSIGTTYSFANTKKVLTDTEMSNVYGGGNCRECLTNGAASCPDSSSSGLCTPPDCNASQWTACPTQFKMKCYDGDLYDNCSDTTTGCDGSRFYYTCAVNGTVCKWVFGASASCSTAEKPWCE